MMPYRLLHGLLAIYHARRADRHYRLYRRHVAARLGLPAARQATQACPAGTILLAAIVGMVICALWIGITWRAM